MSDKELSREEFGRAVFGYGVQMQALRVCDDSADIRAECERRKGLLVAHDLALRADRDRWKARVEAQPDAVQGLVDALGKLIELYDGGNQDAVREMISSNKLDAAMVHVNSLVDAARAALKTYEESKAKGGE